MTEESISKGSTDFGHPRGRVRTLVRQLGAGGASHAIALSYVVLHLCVATVLARRDILTAWDTWLTVHVGLLLPVMALRMSFQVFPQAGATREPYLAKVRFGASRRRLLLGRLAIATLGFALLNLVLVLIARALTLPRSTTLLTADFFVSCGISLLATGTYIPFFGAAQRLGMGQHGAIAAFVIDLTFGHVVGGWSLLTPHRHLAEMLGTSGIFLVSARTSSWVLLAIAVLSSSWILVRTRD